MTRNRLDDQERQRVRARLNAVVNAPINFLKCPATPEQMLAVWHHDFHKEILDGVELMQTYGYFDYAHSYASRSVVFLAPDLVDTGYGVRFFLESSKRWFLKPSVHKGGEHHMRLTKLGNSNFRVIRRDAFEAAFGSGLQDFLDWAADCAITGPQVVDARRTVYDIMKMISTAGQLKRMVPDMVKYLGEELQESIEEQSRRSPFPAEWATFDKARVERMLIALARGHLVKDIARQQTSGSEFSWVTLAPKEGVVDPITNVTCA